MQEQNFTGIFNFLAREQVVYYLYLLFDCVQEIDKCKFSIWETMAKLDIFPVCTVHCTIIICCIVYNVYISYSFTNTRKIYPV